ncbi:MAG: hypothetical protein ACK5JN_17255 [Kluyvera sp.]|uniref:hypothetical protein n=1 Tax=Kluyvera sp. TaxID=1538228 RepID=UPI003A8618E6
MSIVMNNGAAQSEEGAVRAIALATAAAAGGLVLKMTTSVGVGVSLLLLAALAASAALGALLASQRAFARYGFMLAAAGWLLVLLTLLNGHVGIALLPGMLIAGLGLGLAHGRCAVQMRMGSTLSVIAAVAAAWWIQTHAAPGLMGYVFAFALPIDLALLGALLVRIAEQEGR